MRLFRFANSAQAPLKSLRDSLPPRRSAWFLPMVENVLAGFKICYFKFIRNNESKIDVIFKDTGTERLLGGAALGQADRRGGKSARRLSAIIFLISLGACSHPYNFITENKPLMLDVEVDSGPPNYRAGYHDGCISALAAYGNSYQKTLYKLERNPDYQNDKVYTQIWKDAWGYCYMWMFAYNNEKTVSMYGKPLF